MEQKITWMHCLIFGISIFILLSFSKCGDVDYRVRADFIYINETVHTIEIISEKPFTLPPNSDYVIKIDSDGGKNISADSYVPPFSDGIVIYDDIKCDTLASGAILGQGEGPAGIQNYQSKKISDRYYEFTYRFTEDHFLLAEECN